MSAHRILVLTTSRADYGIYRPVLAAMAQEPSLSPALIVTGSHLSQVHGHTIDEIIADGFEIAAIAPCLEPDDTPTSTACAMANAVRAVAEILAGQPCDLLMVLGDRFEMLAGALASIPARLKTAHLHGGEETEGAIDNVMRHMLTKLAHLHFCATPQAGRRIVQMGEAPGRVHVVGAPGLDAARAIPILPRRDLLSQLGMDEAPFHLVTYHPVTLDPEATQHEQEALIEVLQASPQQALITAANADPSGEAVNGRWRAHCETHPKSRLVSHLGAQRYHSAMAHAELMIGNSSSGIIEAASHGLPVINIGERQKGRERSANTLDVAGTAKAIGLAIETARAPDFRNILRTRPNVYGDGRASQRIADILVEALDAGIPAGKAFHDVTEALT